LDALSCSHVFSPPTEHPADAARLKNSGEVMDGETFGERIKVHAAKY
jgi:hypothetical protein